MLAERYRELELLVWSGAWRTLREQELAPPGTWVHAAQLDARDFSAASLVIPATTFAGCHRLAAILMIKDEADIISENLEWLHRCGVRKFIIMDNESGDRTPQKLRQFRLIHKDSEVIIISDPIVRHVQSEKMTGMARLAMSIWPDVEWILPLDADEFLIPMEGWSFLNDIDASIDCLVVPRTVHFRKRGVTDRDWLSPMADMPLRCELFAASPKIIARRTDPITITQGNHGISSVKDIMHAGGFKFGLYIREFPNRSLEHFITKVRNGGRAIIAAHQELRRDVGGQHWLNAYSLLINHGPKSIFEQYDREFLKVEEDGFIVDPFEVSIPEIRYVDE